MGTIFAPAHANIFMANFQLKYIYLYIKDKTNIFLGFVDELFMILLGSEQEVLHIMSDFKKHPSIKFEFKYSQAKLEFLDVLDLNTILQTTIYRKQTDQQIYLDAR